MSFMDGVLRGRRFRKKRQISPNQMQKNFQDQKVKVDEQWLVEKVKKLHKTNDLSDVEFVLGEPPTRFQSHRFILAMASDVFRAMFYGNLAEKQLVIRIEDVEPEAFKNILLYIYTGELDISDFGTAMATVYAAKKYLLPEQITDLCMQYAETYLDENTIWDAFATSFMFSHRRLLLTVKFYNIVNIGRILTSDEFYECPACYMHQLVEDVSLYVPPVLLFTSLVHWAKSQKETLSNGLRAVMEPLLPNILFLAMTAEEFMRNVGGASILTDQEFTTIALDIVKGRGSRRAPQWLNPQRSLTPMSLDYVVQLETSPIVFSDYSESVHLVFSFQVLINSVFLKGVVGLLKSTLHHDFPHTATLTYVNHTTNFSIKTVCKVETPIQLKKGEFRCSLPSPRILEENDSVTLSLQLRSDAPKLRCPKGDIQFRKYSLQSGKVIIQSYPVRDCGLLRGIVLTHVL